MIKSQKYRWFLISTSLVLSINSTALQSQPVTKGILEEIIVTAQKRAESLQDVGVAVSAFNQEQLDKLGIKDGRDLFDRLPNVSLQSNSTDAQAQVSIRGLSFPTFVPIGVQPVGIFQDEVNLNSPQVTGLSLFDLERLEVVRGPQNILYGRNTTAGAVNYISNKPKIGGGINGRLGATYGKYDQIDVEGALGFEIGEQAAGRIAFISQNRDGIFKNTFLDTDDTEREKIGVRAQVLFQPGEDFEILLNGHYGESDADARRTKSIGVLDPANPRFGSFNPAAGSGGNCPAPDKGELGSNCVNFSRFPAGSDDHNIQSELDKPRDKVDAWGGFINIQKGFGKFTLTSISGYETNDFNHAEDFDSVADLGLLYNFTRGYFYQNSEQEQYSQEIRLASSDDQVIRWIGGAYYFYEDTDTEIIVSYPAPTQNPAGFNAGRSSRVKQTDELFSAYAQIEWDVIDNLTAIVGARYVWEEKEGDYHVIRSNVTGFTNEQFSNGFTFQDLLDNGARGGSFPPAPDRDDFGETWSDYGLKLGIEYSTVNDMLLYASISRGIKAGGFTTSPGQLRAGVSDPVNPEVVWTYEGGLKAQWMDNTLRANLALFYNDFSNQQLQTFFVEGTGANQTITSRLLNIGESTTYGAELEVNWIPLNGLYIDLALGLLDTEIDQDDTGRNLEGNDLTNAPNLSFHGSVRKEWELNGGILSVQFEGFHTSEREFDIGNLDVFRDGSYEIYNASAHFEFGTGRQYRLSVWGKNITDEVYLQNKVDAGNGDMQVWLNDPVSFGVTFNMVYD